MYQHVSENGVVLDFGMLYISVDSQVGSERTAFKLFYSEAERKELAKWLQLRCLEVPMAPLSFIASGVPWELYDDGNFDYILLEGTSEYDPRYVAVLLSAREGGNVGSALSTEWSFSANEYQQLTKRTAQYYDLAIPPLAYLGLKLTGEAGEVSDKLGKLWRDHAGVIDEEAIIALEKELGDVLWYLARLADELELPLEHVMLANLQKLQDRFERGVLRGDGDER